MQRKNKKSYLYILAEEDKTLLTLFMQFFLCIFSTFTYFLGKKCNDSVCVII